METRWHPAVTPDHWMKLALDYIRQAEAQARSGAFHIVLAGGNTPRRLYEALAAENHDWSRWHVWFGDERCLPPDDAERNSVLVSSSLLRNSAIPPDQVHVIPAELGPDAAAPVYIRALGETRDFDLTLLGLGEDGHTASLFPGQDWGTGLDAPDVLPVHDAPKPPPRRVSLSARRLARARHVLFLVAGREKREAVARWQAGEHLPASAIHPPGGVDVLLSPESLPGAKP